jgi:hypothetical protein
VTRRGSYTTGAAFGLASFALLAVIGIGGGIVIARLYKIEVIGALALALVPAGICGTLSTLQEQAAMVREVVLLPPRHPRITGLFVAVLAFSTGLTVLVGFIIAGLATLVLQGPVGRPDLVLPALVLLAEYVILSNLYWNADMVFTAFRAGQPLFWMRLVHAVVYLVTAVLFAVFGRRIPSGASWPRRSPPAGSRCWSGSSCCAGTCGIGVPIAVVREEMRFFPESCASASGSLRRPSPTASASSRAR